MEGIRVLLIFAIVGLEALASNSEEQPITPNLSEDGNPKIKKCGELTPSLNWGDLLIKYREPSKDLDITSKNQTENYLVIQEISVEESDVPEPLNITSAWTTREQQEGFVRTLVRGGSCTNCRNCTNCVSSANLTNCTNCTSCTNCTNCKHCTGCINCIGCENCVNCINCTNCKNKSNCINCHC